jgi:peptidoglycan/LPS O-acetylase OafA/YrhL
VEGYRKDIDGLRAIAVLAVIANHYDFGLYGGYVGVDIFFVISGYLITGTILSDISKSTFSLANFTERRVRRILPASMCVSFATLATAYFLFLPADFIDLAKSVMAQNAFVSNYFFWNSSGYFAEASETKPLLHTWSLSLEEQFYICFALLLLLKNLRNPQKLFWIFLIAFFISLFISEYCSFKHPSVNYFFLPTRAYEILLGGILAIAFDSLKNFPIIFKELISWCGLSLIVFSMLFFDESTRFPGLSALLPCFGAALLILSGAGKNTNVSKVLSVKPFVFIGLISYSLYLWHWPIISFAKYLTIEPLSLDNPSDPAPTVFNSFSFFLAVY